MPYEPGQLILNGKYRIEAFIGQGAFAQVYRATHIDLNAPRAIKVLDHDSPGVGSSDIAEYRKRFQLEKQLGAKIHHVNVIEVHDSGTEDDKVMLVMEYAAGGSLAQRLNNAKESNTPLTIDECVSIALGVAEGLSAIHALDVVHRDIKPSNILFDAQGRVKVADLGLAQVPGGPSHRSMLGDNAPLHPGTLEYMSPEQRATYDYLTSASDIYALGLVLFEILTRRIYRNMRPDTTVSAMRADVPQWLDDLVARMLADEPRNRPWDGAEAVKLLRSGQTEDAAARAAIEQVRHDEDARQQAEATRLAQLEAERKAAEERRRREEEERQRKKAERRARVLAFFGRTRTAVARGWLVGLVAIAALVVLWVASTLPAAPTGTKLIAIGITPEVTQVPITATPQPTVTNIPTREPSPTITRAPTDTPTPAASSTQVPTPAASRTPEPTATSTPPPTATRKPTTTRTPAPVVTPTPKPVVTLAVGGGQTLKLSANVSMQLVYVSPGPFTMGSADSDKDAQRNEKPQHKVTLSGYWIGKYEVTNAQYLVYAQVKGLNWAMPEGRENHPVVNVSWDDAVAFSAWVSEVSGRKVRLPTEAEWEKAARGTDERIYPWGNAEPTCSLANYYGCGNSTLPVGSKPAGASPYGALDMAGNVWEWVADWYDEAYYANSPASNPQGAAAGQYRVLRGGSWNLSADFVRAARRVDNTPNLRSGDDGFRVAVSSAPVP